VRPDVRWEVAPDVGAEDLAARLQQVGARTREVLASHALEETARPGGPLDDGAPPDLEWICFHVVTEYARHLGQLDVAVEVRGTTPPPDN
jgi:hypothetical protein